MEGFTAQLKVYLGTKMGSEQTRLVGFDDKLERVTFAVIPFTTSLLQLQPNYIVRPYYDLLKDLVETEFATLNEKFASAFPYGMYVRSGSPLRT